MMKSAVFETKFLFYMQYNPNLDSQVSKTITEIFKNGNLDNIKNNNNNINSNNQSNNDFINNLASTFEKINASYPGLNKILTRNNIMKTIEGMNDNQLKEFYDLLPEGQQNKQGFIDNISSPQFLQALSSLTHVLNSENFVVVMSSFGLDFNSVQQCSNGVEAFIKCIIQKFKK